MNVLLSNAVKAPGVQLAKVKVDSVFTAPCSTSVLYPADGGNMHCFTALTPCAVLDVLCPPYSDPDGRHCAYYLDFPFSRFPGTMLAPLRIFALCGFLLHLQIGMEKNLKNQTPIKFRCT